MLVLAVSQDRRVLWLTLIVILTFSYNIFQVAISYLAPSINLVPNVFSLGAAVLNCIILIILMWFILHSKVVPELREPTSVAT